MALFLNRARSKRPFGPNFNPSNAFELPVLEESQRLSAADFPGADLNEAALRRTHSRVAEPTVEVI
jgi:hypothetical protein